MPELVFSPEGNRLFHSYQGLVAVWNIPNSKLDYKRPGSLLAVAQNGKSFQTTEAFWDTDTGSELDFSSIDPENYPLHQRLHISEVRTNKGQQTSYGFELIDSFGIRPRQFIHLADIGKHGGINLAEWEISPDDQYIAVNLYVNILGHDLDCAQCFDLNTGEKVFDFPTEWGIEFSDTHHLMAVFHRNGCTVYDLLTRQEVTEKVYFFARWLHPKDRWLVAYARENTIYLRDMRRKSPRRAIKGGVAEILGFAFHPEGREIAAALSNGSVCFWDIKTGKLVMTWRVGI